MKIVLISLAEDIAALGVRSLAAYLKQYGHSVRLIFLRGLSKKSNYIYQYPESVIKEVIELCQGSNLIGISVYTNYWDRVVQLTKELKAKLPQPILWGNLHPTVRPEESLRYADMICLGEGEEALLELVNKMEQGEDIYHIRNLWFKKQDQIIKNDPRPLIQNLDALPFCDFTSEDDYLLDFHNRFRRVDLALFKEFLPRFFNKNYELKTSFGILASRGCPHACSYCGNNARKRIYAGQCYLRFRSPEHIVKEIETNKERYPFITMISFIDDAFTAQRIEWLETFCKLYKERINLPFGCFASPETLNEEKLKLLIEVGLEHIGIGVQSGSDRIQKLYKRYIGSDKVLKVGGIIQKYIDKIAPPCYDIIVDNPYETDDDKLATLDLLLKLPSPYRLSLFSLVFYPGTDLNVLAKEDGILKDEIKEVARKAWGKPEYNGYNFLLHLLGFGGNVKGFVSLFLRRSLFIFINQKIFNPFWKLIWSFANFCFLIKQGWLALIKGDLYKKIKWFFRPTG